MKFSIFKIILLFCCISFWNVFFNGLYCNTFVHNTLQSQNTILGWSDVLYLQQIFRCRLLTSCFRFFLTSFLRYEQWVAQLRNATYGLTFKKLMRESYCFTNNFVFVVWMLETSYFHISHSNTFVHTTLRSQIGTCNVLLPDHRQNLNNGEGHLSNST